MKKENDISIISKNIPILRRESSIPHNKLKLKLKLLKIKQIQKSRTKPYKLWSSIWKLPDNSQIDLKSYFFLLKFLMSNKE